jgi:hypothetical protein
MTATGTIIARAINMTERPMTEAVPIDPVVAEARSELTEARSESEARVPEADDDAALRYRHARQMIADAIDAHIGRQGHDLIARLEQTTNVLDLHGLLPDFAKALVRRVGLEPATPIVSSVERLISGA